MPMLKIFVDDDMLRFLRERAERDGRAVEDLAEAAVENAAYEVGFKKPAPLHWTTELQIATNGN